MAALPSLMIEEFPALADETLVSLNQACVRFPVKVSRGYLERMIRVGARGVMLESIYLAGRRYTSIEAIRRFIERTQYKTPDAVPAPPKPATMSAAELKAKSEKYFGKEAKGGFAP